ncbi:MAG: hypothetical protein ACE5G9_07045 [Nitrospinales bacterium]
MKEKASNANYLLYIFEEIPQEFCVAEEERPYKETILTSLAVYQFPRYDKAKQHAKNLVSILSKIKERKVTMRSGLIEMRNLDLDKESKLDLDNFDLRYNENDEENYDPTFWLSHYLGDNYHLRVEIVHNHKVLFSCSTNDGKNNFGGQKNPF